MQNGKAEQPVWTWTANGANKKLVLHVQLLCGSLSITTPVSYLANEFDVRSELHRQVSLAPVNQILCSSWGYEWLKNSKDSLKACFDNVNIILWFSSDRMNIPIGFTTDNPVQSIFSSWLVVLNMRTLLISISAVITDIKLLNVLSSTLGKCLFICKHHFSVISSVLMVEIFAFCHQILMTF